MRQLNAVDAMFVYNETVSSPLHISSIQIYEPPEAGRPPVRYKDILRRFEERLPKTPIFRRKLSRVTLDLDTPYWVDDPDFDLEFHVRHIALPAPGDWRQFCILVARLQSRSLDLARPPWEIYVIEGMDNINGLPKGSWALMFKTHHSAIDGSTGSEMLSVLHDLQPDPPVSEPPDHWIPEREPSQFEMLGRGYLNQVKKVFQVRSLVRNAIKSRSKEIKERFTETNHSIALKERTRFNENIGPHRVFGGLRLELGELKQIKNAVAGATLNDTLLSIVSGAMRHYLVEKNEAPEGPLVAFVPISTRSEDQVGTQGGNQVSGMNVSLGADISNPLERLKAINQDAINFKAYANAVGVDLMSSVINTVPTSLMSMGMRVASNAGLMSKTPTPHTTLTNVPGPQYPLYFCGAKVSLTLGLGCLLDGTGLFHTVYSYNGYVALSFLACKEMIPDPEFYHQCINRSFQEHLEAAQALEKPASKRRKPAPRRKAKSSVKRVSTPPRARSKRIEKADSPT